MGEFIALTQLAGVGCIPRCLRLSNNSNNLGYCQRVGSYLVGVGNERARDFINESHKNKKLGCLKCEVRRFLALAHAVPIILNRYKRLFQLHRQNQFFGVCESESDRIKIFI